MKRLKAVIWKIIDRIIDRIACACAYRVESMLDARTEEPPTILITLPESEGPQFYSGNTAGIEVTYH